jgi:hypothetical protein
MQTAIYANLLTSPACLKRMPAVPASNGEIRFTLHEIRTTKAYVRKNKLFLQNKAKFRKVKLNVNKVLTRDYEQMDTWWSGITKPIKAN